MKHLLLGLLFFALAHVTTWFQLNGQFLWTWFQKNTFILALFGIPISYVYIWATTHIVQYFDGTMWPSRFIGFGVGIIIYALLVNYFFKEGLNPKTLVSLGLSIIIILIQILWKT